MSIVDDAERDVERDVTVLELLDRLLDKGVVLTGEITLAVADVDLIELRLRVMLASTERAHQLREPAPRTSMLPDWGG